MAHARDIFSKKLRFSLRACAKLPQFRWKINSFLKWHMRNFNAQNIQFRNEKKKKNCYNFQRPRVIHGNKETYKISILVINQQLLSPHKTCWTIKRMNFSSRHKKYEYYWQTNASIMISSSPLKKKSSFFRLGEYKIQLFIYIYYLRGELFYRYLL